MSLFTRSLVLAIIVGAGCAGVQQPGVTNASGETVNSDGTICREETPTGSNISHTVCRNAETRTQDHEQAERAIRPRPVAAPAAGP
jgi:hypothetical protein